MAKFNAFENGSKVGALDNSALAEGHKAHAHWLTLEDDAEFKIDWCVGYMHGMFKLSQTTGRKWAEMTRTTREAIEVVHPKKPGEMTTAERMWNAATAQWTYYVINDGSKNPMVNSMGAVKFSRVQLAAIRALAATGVTMNQYGQGMKQLGIKAAK